MNNVCSISRPYLCSWKATRRPNESRPFYPKLVSDTCPIETARTSIRTSKHQTHPRLPANLLPVRASKVGSPDDLLSETKTSSKHDFAWGMDKPLDNASPEQQAIVDSISTRSTNVYVNAVAGSGKTTALLHVAKALPQRMMLVRDPIVRSPKISPGYTLSNFEGAAVEATCVLICGLCDSRLLLQSYNPSIPCIHSLIDLHSCTILLLIAMSQPSGADIQQKTEGRDSRRYQAAWA